MMYRNIEVKFAEANVFSNGNDYKIKGGTKMVFEARSEYGRSYGLTPFVALQGAKEQIDCFLDVDF